MVGATTRTGLLNSPLHSRFTLQIRLDYNTREDLAYIINRSTKLLGIDIDSESAYEIASRSTGTPRIANNLLRFVRDFSQQKSNGVISKAITMSALEMLEIDIDGLDEMDIKILSCTAQNYSGRPVGFWTVAIVVEEEVQTLKEVNEPYLIKEGYIQCTPQGRLLTDKGWKKVWLEHAIFQQNF